MYEYHGFYSKYYSVNYKLKNYEDFGKSIIKFSLGFRVSLLRKHNQTEVRAMIEMVKLNGRNQISVELEPDNEYTKAISYQVC